MSDIPNDNGQEDNSSASTTTSLIKVESITDKMSSAYLDYAYSVIVGRAIPDVRDGLKPVHKRILYSMYQNRFFHNTPHKKCARIVGDVLGKYHPHGDTSVYGALVRMAQTFSLRYPLIDSQGNFGSIDGDEPAAMRYTEARLSEIANELVADIEKDTVDFIPNYDESLTEPVYLPSKIPNLLINGTSGIAVGMRTYMPPHNLNEIASAIIAVIDKPEMYPEELSNYIIGPDFPTRGIIVGKSGIRQIINTGRGKLIVRGRIEYEEEKNHRQLIITELPYQVNKSKLVESIANLVNNKKVTGVTDLTDESARGNIRIVIELNRNADSNVITNQLYNKTNLQTSFSIINLVLVNNGKQPYVLNMMGLIKSHIDCRENIIIRRTKYELKRAQKRVHIAEGLVIAILNIDEIVALIKSSRDSAEARKNLIDKFTLSEEQAKEILDMPLRRLTALQVQKLYDEIKQLEEDVKDYNNILNDKDKRMGIIKQELTEIKKKYGDDRKTEILDVIEEESSEEDRLKTVVEETCVIVLTENQYFKRMTLKTYRSQRRGGKGKKGMTKRDEDVIKDVFILSSHDRVLMFTKYGRVYNKYAYEFPLMSRTSRGKAIVNFMGLKPGEKIVHLIPISDFSSNISLIFCTRKGIVKKIPLKEFKKVRKSGVQAIRLREGDELINALLNFEAENNVLIATKKGFAIKFSPDTELRPLGRTAMGVRGIRLREGDEVVDMVIGDDKTEIITITNRGYGKRSKMKLYRKIKRGGKGVINIKFRHKDDHVKAVNTASDEDILIVTTSGMIIRVPSVSLRTLSRSAKGVRVINLNEGDFVSSVALCEASCDEDEEISDKTEISENEKTKSLENQKTESSENEKTKSLENQTTEISENEKTKSLENQKTESSENHKKQTEE